MDARVVALGQALGTASHRREKQQRRRKQQEADHRGDDNRSVPPELSPLTRFLDRALGRGHDRAVQELPPTAWFLAYVATAFACFHWHNRQPSRHLKLMGWGMCLAALLALPSLFSAWAGHKQLVFYADKIMPAVDRADLYERMRGDAGVRLLLFCLRLFWIPYAIFALGLWRFSKEAVARVAYPSADQA